MPEFCRSCKAQVVWTVTPAGARAPIDAEPDRERGNVLLLRSDVIDGGVLSVVLSGLALSHARPSGKLRLNHWATCPDREEWRRKVEAERAAASD